MIQKKGLGRGLESLLGATYGEEEIIAGEEKITTGVTEVRLSLIDPNPKQPRKNFETEALNELASSIKVHGVIQPIVLTKRGERFMIIAGERRWRASKIAEMQSIPAVVKDFTEKQIKEITIIENLQREDLNPIEMARAIKELMDEFKMTQEVIAERIGVSRPVVANSLRMLTLPIEVLRLVETGRLSAGHAKMIVSVETKEGQIKLANMACDNKMTVRDLEQAVKNLYLPRPIVKDKPK